MQNNIKSSGEIRYHHFGPFFQCTNTIKVIIPAEVKVNVAIRSTFQSWYTVSTDKATKNGIQCELKALI